MLAKRPLAGCGFSVSGERFWSAGVQICLCDQWKIDAKEGKWQFCSHLCLCFSSKFNTFPHSKTNILNLSHNRRECSLSSCTFLTEPKAKTVAFPFFGGLLNAVIVHRVPLKHICLLFGVFRNCLHCIWPPVWYKVSTLLLYLEKCAVFCKHCITYFIAGFVSSLFTHKGELLGNDCHMSQIQYIFRK